MINYILICQVQKTQICSHISEILYKEGFRTVDTIWIQVIIIILFAREQHSKQAQMTVEMSRTIRRKDTHLQMPFNLPPPQKKYNKHTETSTAS